MSKTAKRSAVIATVAAVAVGGLGVTAWAAGWFAEGTATGTAQSSDIQPLAATITLDGKVFPGARRNATVSVTNPNDFKVALNKAEAPTFSAKKTDGTENAACAGTLNANVVKITGFSGSPTIAAGAKGQAITLPVEIGDLDQKCAGSLLTVTMKFGGTSTV
ncbi:hypothetical protein [Symbioplanes lichenis]|uniref:hypothetical protein n=1 Tax=Symbioplanes lichenis TaxID=1629072 RepID=UPI002739F833|nr:hypothetical protein [Actinoplanes lichenis]